jgi:hypothetical protein
LSSMNDLIGVRRAILISNSVPDPDFVL